MVFSSTDLDLIAGFIKLVESRDTEKIKQLEKILRASDKAINRSYNFNDFLTFTPLCAMLRT